MITRNMHGFTKNNSYQAMLFPFLHTDIDDQETVRKLMVTKGESRDKSGLWD